jgi:hypothetical protein
MLIDSGTRKFVREVSNFLFIEHAATLSKQLVNPECHIEINHKISTTMQEIQRCFLLL